MKYRILASEKFEVPERFREIAEIDVFDDLWANTEKLVAIAKGYSALIVRNMTQLDSDLLDKLGSIRVIGRLGAGTENIDVHYASQRNISVVYAPVQNTNAVAEFCVAQVFNALRHMPDAIDEARQGVWERSKYLSSGREIAACKIGVIGFGNIGKSFAQKMKALGANVLVYNRTPSKVTPPFHFTPLDSLLKNSDVISIHLPGGSATRDFIHADNIGMMKKGGILINSSRGDIVNEKALLSALESKHLGRAMLDVRCYEPASADALAMHENVNPTPHIAAFTKESQSAISGSVITDVLRVLGNEIPNFPVTSG